MITRRGFLQTATGAALAAATRRPLAAAGPEPRLPAIDTHIHLYDTSRPKGVTWPDKNDPKDASIYYPHLPAAFAAMTAPYRILGEVVIEASTWVEDNQWILDLAKDNPGIVGYMGAIEPGSPEFAGYLRRFGADPIFRGLRLRDKGLLMRLNEPAVRDDLSRLADRRLTLDITSTGTVLPDLVRLAHHRPDLRIVIDHLPFTEWDGNPAAMRAALAEAAACPNVYAKISMVTRQVNGRVTENPAFYRPGLDTLCDLFGNKRVLYASNWSASERHATYANIYRVVSDYFAGRSRADAENFFWRNSIAAYDWRPRGAAAALIQSAAS